MMCNDRQITLNMTCDVSCHVTHCCVWQDNQPAGPRGPHGGCAGVVSHLLPRWQTGNMWLALLILSPCLKYITIKLN